MKEGKGKKEEVKERVCAKERERCDITALLGGCVSLFYLCVCLVWPSIWQPGEGDGRTLSS